MNLSPNNDHYSPNLPCNINIDLLSSICYNPIQYAYNSAQVCFSGAPARQCQSNQLKLSLEVVINGACGRQSRKTLLKIHKKHGDTTKCWESSNKPW